MKYAYPAIFTPEEEGGYSIRFTDIEGCYTQGEDIADGIEMAQDVLALNLYNLEESGDTIPAPSMPNDIECTDGEFVTMVCCDTIEYRKMYEETPMYGQNKKVGGLFNKTPEEKAEKKATKEAKKINDELEEEYLYDRKHWDEVANAYINESEFSPLFENIRKSNNEKLSKDYDKVNDMFKDYLKNEDEYVARAAIANSIIGEETTLENIGRMTRLYLMDDLDQGYANSSDLYARYEKNIDDKEIERLYQSLYNNKDMYNENVKYLKDNNKVLSKVNDMLLLELCKENEDEHNTTRKNEAYWCLYDAADGSSHNGDLEKDAYNKAKKITEKLHKSCSGNDGWYYLNQAIDNLNLNSIELRNMTQADWDKINAEINKLKK